MSKIPTFKIYGEGDSTVEQMVQPYLEMRDWEELSKDEKNIALQQIINNGWVNNYSEEILNTIEYLNYNFLRKLPGISLHQIKPEYDIRGRGNEYARKEAALDDFSRIFIYEESSSLVLKMITKFASCHIDYNDLDRAKNEDDEGKSKQYIEDAYQKFDRLANCLNHILEQFRVNAALTRGGLIPRQDEKITEQIYVPTLGALADPKWKSVSASLSQMFDDFRDKNYAETITKAHAVVQRFLQILVGEEGKNAKGELKYLFAEAKNKGIIPVDRFTQPIISAFESFLPAERATKSTAKPAKEEATLSDALLVMNVTMVFLQHCLQSK